MKIKVILGILLGAGLSACSSYFVASYKTDTTAVDATQKKAEWVESYIQPYKDSLDADMGKNIAFTDVDLIVERPSGNLNNWVADACYNYGVNDTSFEGPIFSLFNKGGIRSNLNKGDITLGDMFKMMPFDNEIVYVILPMSVLPEIEAYLRKSGGEPISNALLDAKGLHINGATDTAEKFMLITSDYLAAGGDKMYFMKKNIELIQTGAVMRDVLIKEASRQYNLKIDSTIRIQL